MKHYHIIYLILLLSIVSLVHSCKGSNTNNFSQTETKNNDSLYLETSKKIVQEAQSILAKNLTNAIKTGGSEYAVKFCNTRALTLTDSMAHILNSNLKRVTDKPRNQSNQASDEELEYIQILKDKMLKGERPTPRVIRSHGKIIGLFPIVTNSMCLLCHGKKETDILGTTLKKINELYPTDKATGYGENEIRGLWVVELAKNK